MPQVTQSPAVLTAIPDSRYPRQFHTYADNEPIGLVHEKLNGEFYAQFSATAFGPDRGNIEDAMDDMGAFAVAKGKQAAKEQQANDDLFDHMTQSWGHTYTPGAVPVNNVHTKPVTITPATTQPHTVAITPKPEKAAKAARVTSKVRSDGKVIPVSYGKPAPPRRTSRKSASRKAPATAKTSSGRVLSID